MAARLAPLITAVMGGQPGRATLRELDALAARAETLTGSRAGQLAAADVWDWIGRARELSPDPLEATADRALDRSASWWESAGMPERARHARDCIARGQLFRSGVLAPELLRLVTVLRDPAAPANLRVEALLELGQLQLRSGDPAEGVRALRQAGAALSVDPTADWPLQAEQHLLAYRIDRELAVVTGAADRLRTAHHHRQAADRLIAAATGRRADPGPLDLLVDYLDDWDIAAHQDPADPRLQSRAEDLLARWSADPLPHAADVAAAIARRLADLHLRTRNLRGLRRVMLRAGDEVREVRAAEDTDG